MLPWLEFEDKSIEKAVSRACEELNTPKEKLKYDVISYGSTGIFGLVGTKKAKIRVVLPEPDSAKTNENERLEEPADRFQEKKDKTEKEPNRSEKDDIETQTYPDEPVELGRVVLQRIVDFITEGAEISIDKSAERILFKVIGGNSAVLIGKRGQTLEAIQYLVEKVVNKRIESRVRMQIDVEGYLQTRKTNLQRMAERMAEKSKRTGKPVSIGQMNAHDRRIVHLALKHDNRVRTQSMGDGYYRKLVIFPKKNYSQNRK
ncbi:MAG: Jag N-terminal domain-containing protein [Deltaproteobacteria bacterium]|nr:Jag N-terminal domain-containing protein [Deltaproteobacteria bacterium]